MLLFTNILDAEDNLLKDAMVEMFSPDGPSRGRLSKWRRAAATAFWALKTVIGFELGTRKPVSGEPRFRMQSDVLAIVAEIHADLAALHFVFDPKIRELGLVPETECASAVLDGYFSRFLIEASVVNRSAACTSLFFNAVTVSGPPASSAL